MAASREPFNVTGQVHGNNPIPTSSSKSPTSSPAVAGVQHSGWHSPVPYLFGGLAAMLGLIAFALLILACSYWKLSGYLEGTGAAEQSSSDTTGDIESGNNKNSGEKKDGEFEEKIYVIMPGEDKPTHLATPTFSCSSSFNSSIISNGGASSSASSSSSSSAAASRSTSFGDHGNSNALGGENLEISRTRGSLEFEAPTH